MYLFYSFVYILIYVNKQQINYLNPLTPQKLFLATALWLGFGFSTIINDSMVLVV